MEMDEIKELLEVNRGGVSEERLAGQISIEELLAELRLG